jgi:hypothetical protein
MSAHKPENRSIFSRPGQNTARNPSPSPKKQTMLVETIKLQLNYSSGGEKMIKKNK